MFCALKAQWLSHLTLVVKTGLSNGTVFLSRPSQKLNANEKLNLDAEITIDEITNAINKFKANKCPGLDGLPIEFYSKFQNKIAEMLCVLYQECKNLGYMANSMHTGIISQLYKGKGEKSERSNWRPLTMLNVDYKILAKILTERLKNVMGKLVHPDQTCGVSGRDIRDGIMQMYNIFENNFAKKENFIFASVDHFSAFDTIEWDFMIKCLRYYKFGFGFINWIKTIYNPCHVLSRINVNGYLSQNIRIKRGGKARMPSITLALHFVY